MTGRYRHLTRPVQPLNSVGYAESRSSTHGYPVATTVRTAMPIQIAAPGAIHHRSILFIVVALLVGGGLLSVVPNLSPSDVTNDLPVLAGQSGVTSQSQPTSEPAAEGTPKKDPVAVPVPAAATSVDGPGALAQGAMATISPIFTSEVQYWAPKIVAWSATHGLDPNIVATIMQIESCGDPAAASHAGAQGLFQVMPFHFAPGEDMLNPDTNAMRGLAFYNRQLEYTGQDIYLSFAGYNGGYAASGSSYPYWANETQRYFSWASGIFDEANAGHAESPTLQRWLEAGGASLCQAAAQRLGL